MNSVYLHINTRDEFIRVDINKIVYFEADGNYTNIVFANKLRSVVCMNLAHMQQLLSDNLKEHARTFVRVGKRHIINHSFVCQINVLRQNLVLSDGINFVFHLDISKEALKNLRELYLVSLNR